jgi:hypothetical protein
MARVLAGLTWDVALVYLDGIICFSANFEEHLLALKKIFSRLQEANLSLKPTKCEFGKGKLRFLGHIVSDKGIDPVEEKVKIMEKFKIPKTVKEVRQFLGMTGYYRKHIEGYSKIAAPLTDLTKGSMKILPTSIRQIKESTEFCTNTGIPRLQ